MNSREKTLIFVLFGVAFFVINIFLFTSFQSAMQKKRSQLDVGAKKLKAHGVRSGDMGIEGG